MKAKELITAYYSAFNRKDWDSMLSLLSPEVVHDINQGHREKGMSAFKDFMAIMDAHYEESIEDLVVMSSEDNSRASAEFNVRGIYKKTQPGLPPASGQKYLIPVGAFFSVANGKILRVTNYYNLQEWLRQISS